MLLIIQKYSYSHGYLLVVQFNSVISILITIWLYLLPLSLPLLYNGFFHGSLNVPIEHHPTIRYMVFFMATTIRWCPIFPSHGTFTNPCFLLTVHSRTFRPSGARFRMAPQVPRLVQDTSALVAVAFDTFDDLLEFIGDVLGPVARKVQINSVEQAKTLTFCIENI